LTISNAECTSFFEDHLFVDQVINNVVKIFSTVKHVDNQVLFHLLFIVLYVLCEGFVSFIKVYQKAIIFIFKLQFLISYEVNIAIYPYNRDFEIKLIDDLCDLLVYLLAFSFSEW
jgi:hypothetical protein